jgi:hypothetical protein
MAALLVFVSLKSRLNTMFFVFSCTHNTFSSKLKEKFVLTSSEFLIRPSGLFHIRINLELWILQTVGRAPWTGDQPCLKAATYTGQDKHKKRGHISMPKIGFEPRTPVFEQTKTFYTSDRAVTVTGMQ